MTRYTVVDPRFVLNSGKGAEKNPDRLGTIHGTFTDENGNELSVTSKVITFEMAANPETVIDIDNGILVLPSGERGRKPSVGVNQANINSLLENARKSAAK